MKATRWFTAQKWGLKKSPGSPAGVTSHPITSGAWSLRKTLGPKENPADPPDTGLEDSGGIFPGRNLFQASVVSTRLVGGREAPETRPWGAEGGARRERRLQREEPAEGGARGGRSPGSPGGGRRTDHFGAAVDSTGSQAQPTGPELQRPRGNGPPRDLARRSRGRGQGRAEPPCSRSHERGRHLQRAAPHPVPQARRPALPQPGRLWHSLVGTTRRLARAGGSEAPTHPHAAARQVGCRRGAPRSRGLGRPQPGRTMVMRRLRRSESLSPWANLVQGRNYPGRASDFATRPASPPTRGVPTL